MPTKEVMQLHLNVKEIVEGPNCRSRMNPAKFEELVQNVKKVGVLEPALVRRDENGKFALIAGHRRLAAAKAAGLKEIPVRLLEVDEKQATEIQALENLHREDLSPLDEARAFKRLLDIGSHTVETLAAQVDKSVQYVYRSLRLLELPARAIKALEEGLITPGHAHQILRAPEKNAEALAEYATTRLEWQKRYPTVDELRERTGEMGYMLVKFTGTRGGTELGFPLDRDATDISGANFDESTGKVHVEGHLTLNDDPVRCIATIDLATLKGSGRLVLEEKATATAE